MEVLPAARLLVYVAQNLPYCHGRETFPYGTSSHTHGYAIDFINPDCHLLGEKNILAEIVLLVRTAYAAGFGAGFWFLAASPGGVADATGKLRGPHARNAQRDEDAFSNHLRRAASLF